MYLWVSVTGRQALAGRCTAPTVALRGALVLDTATFIAYSLPASVPPSSTSTARRRQPSRLPSQLITSERRHWRVVHLPSSHAATVTKELPV